MKKWYAVYVRPRTEKKVALELEEQGIDYFLPLQRTLRQWSDRKKWVDVPLIPSYCFVNITERDMLTTLKVNHIMAFVRFNGRPATIPDNQIDFLRRLLNQSEIPYHLTEYTPEPGEKVRIIAGPFIGCQAEIIKQKNKTKVFLRLEEIQNIVQIEIPLQMIEPMKN